MPRPCMAKMRSASVCAVPPPESAGEIALSIPSVIMAPPPREDGKRKHSRKPLAFTEMIERRFVGPYLEMFARQGDRQRWSYWGDEYNDEEENEDEATDRIAGPRRDSTTGSSAWCATPRAATTWPGPTS